MKKLTSYGFMIMVSILALSVFGCSSTQVKTTQVVPVIHEKNDIPDAQLLDIGIHIFNPGLDQLDKLEDDELVFAPIRVAESN